MDFLLKLAERLDPQIRKPDQLNTSSERFAEWGSLLKIEASMQKSFDLARDQSGRWYLTLTFQVKADGRRVWA